MCYKQFRAVNVDRSTCTPHLRGYNNTRKQQKIFQLPIELKVSKSPKTSLFFLSLFFFKNEDFFKMTVDCRSTHHRQVVSGQVVYP